MPAGVRGTHRLGRENSASESDWSGDNSAGREPGDAGACYVNAGDLGKKEKGEDSSSPQSKTWSIALFHSHHESDGRGAVRQVDLERISIPGVQVHSGHVEVPLLAIPSEQPRREYHW